MQTLVLSGRGRRWAESGHPWIYGNDIASGEAEPGEVAAYAAPDGRVLGHGLYSRASKIALRTIARGADAPPDDWVERRVADAVALRAQHGLLDARGACRLLAGDADGIPGLVADRYADVLVLQCGTLGADRLRARVVDALRAALPFALRAVLDRSDAAARRLEGLEPRVEWLAGVAAGESPGPIEVCEDELVYAVDVEGGHKTGHYLDQRDNRRLAARAAAGARVLDVCCYDGLFGLHALRAGAREVVFVDQNQRALERARANVERNAGAAGRGGAERCRYERADASTELRRLGEAGERFGVVVLDPPAFAKRRDEVEGALRGYRELNRRALALCADGGLLVTASCSYNVLPPVFLDVLRAAAADSGRRVVLEEYRGAAPDHPVLLTLPESWYLKCAFLRVR
ncbi:MAG: class I SAM-dependent rRNA methyltransferase [Planctomycetota bacterium]|nr:MAG: class I SAM-dependent rRNA methyltransferase [Planctomycetota bacterium]